MKKRMTNMLVIACILVFLCAITASATEPAENITASGACGENLSWELDSNKTLTISGAGDMCDFASGTETPWYAYASEIESIVVESGVSSIGNHAFQMLEAVTQVQIPDTATWIGQRAFDSCFELEKVVLPDSVMEMGEGVFSWCTGLKQVTLPANLETINENTFYSCTSLESIDIPEGVTDIYDDAFTNCEKLAQVSWPQGLRTIGKAFKGTALKELIIPGSVKTIAAEAFLGNSALVNIVVPDGVEKIGVHAFAQCPSLKIIYFEGDAPVFGDATNADLLIGEEVTAYYPGDNDTWTEEVRQGVGENVTWVPVLPSLNAPVVQVTNVASTGKVKLSWKAVEGAVSYQVCCATSENGEYTELAQTAQTEYTHEAGEAGVVYYYKVKAIHEDAAANSEYSAVKYRACDLPQPVVTVSNWGSNGKIRVRWNAVEGASSYAVYRATSENGKYTRLITTEKTEITNTSAEVGQTYYYKVRALHQEDAAHSAYSKVEAQTCKLPRPVVGVTNVASTGKVKLSWKAVEGAVSYKIYCATSKNGEYAELAQTTQTQYIHEAAEAGVVYYYKVKAIHADAAADSGYSTVKNRACDLAQPVVTVSNWGSNGKIRVRWNAVEGASSYAVYRATSENGKYARIITTEKTEITNVSVEVGQTYYYKVRALHQEDAAHSAHSKAKTGTCKLPRPVVGVTNVASTGKVKLSWKAVEGAVSYRIYCATSKNGEYTELAQTTQTQYTHEAGEAGVVYYYKVKAVHAETAANSGYSTVKNRACDLARPEVTVSLTSAGKVRVKWNGVDGASKYSVYRSTSRDGSYVKLMETTNTSMTNTSAKSGVTYYYKVRALADSAAANSAYSKVAEITVK